MLEPVQNKVPKNVSVIMPGFSLILETGRTSGKPDFYYERSLKSNSVYEFVNVLTKKFFVRIPRKGMIMDCRAEKIDQIITKSISRFVRNTLDCLNYVRDLKGAGIGVTFEKEAINTLDEKGC